LNILSFFFLDYFFSWVYLDGFDEGGEDEEEEDRRR